jgi:dCTP deaminase
MSIKADRWIKRKSAESFLTISDKNDIVIRKKITTYDIEDLDLRKQVMDMNNGSTLEVNDLKIYKYANDKPLITPFVESSESKLVYRDELIKVPSYGLSSSGYDIRLGRNFKVMNGYRKANSNVIDFASNNLPDFFTEFNDVDSIELAPNGFILGVSMERIIVPRNVLVTCMAKSTIARHGCTFMVTPLENEWSGFITLEIKNETEHPIRLYAGMGCMQLLFHESDEDCEVSYADRNGKYQNQPNVPVAGIC